MRISGYEGSGMHKLHKTLWQPKMFVLGMTLLGHVAFGEDRFMRETPNGFWETNLIATVIGYSGQRTFMGTAIPAIEPSDQYPRNVWLYSIAPTNFSGITFTIHSCGPWSLLSVYPTNQLFIFPASICTKETNISNRLENVVITPHQTVENYCPYRTLEKWFPVTAGQEQHWESYLQREIEIWQKRAAEWRDKLKNASTEQKRTGFYSNRIECALREILSLQCEIEDCKRQPQYFNARIEWLKTQGLNPGPQTTSK